MEADFLLSGFGSFQELKNFFHFIQYLFINSVIVSLITPNKNVNMSQTFTQNDLVRLLYNEVSPEERAEIERLLQRDPALLEEYKMLQEGVQKLDEEPMLNPSAASMNIIQQHSRESIGEQHAI
jgi:hypothetical protein